MSIAVVIPVLEEAQRLSLLLADLARGPEGLVSELVVVDGGSSDSSAELGQLAGATVLHSPASRGRQLQLGVVATTAPWLLLLHGDARLPADWATVVKRALTQPPGAWYFDLAVQGSGLPLGCWRQRWGCAAGCGGFPMATRVCCCREPCCSGPAASSHGP